MSSRAAGVQPCGDSFGFACLFPTVLIKCIEMDVYAECVVDMGEKFYD